MTTYDENGGYPHPDHIRCHQVSVAAYEAAGDYRRYPDAGEPWSVSKLYYNHGFLRKRMQLLQDEFAKHGQEGPVREVAQALGSRARRVRRPGDHPHRVLGVLLAARRRAARPRHPDRPDGDFFAAPDRMAATAVAHRGIRAGALAGAGHAARRPTCSRGSRPTMTDTARDDRSACWPTRRPRDTGPDFGKASPFGLLVVVLLLIGTFLLVWSMNRHLKKLPESFDRTDPEPDQAADDGAVEPDDRRPRRRYMGAPGGQPPRRGHQPVPAPARRQPGALAAVDARGAGRGGRAGRADPAVDRLRGLPLVSRDGPRVVRGRRRRRGDERGLRLHQGRPRGAARPRRGVHERHRRADRAGRLADDLLPHARRHGRSSAAPTTRKPQLPAAARRRRRHLAEPPRRGRAGLRPDHRRTAVDGLRAARRRTGGARPRCATTPSRACCATRTPRAAGSAAHRSSRRRRCWRHCCAATSAPATPAPLAAVERTVHAMARGGIYDQLAGGFARYSVDASWVVPHFEKMLYDNALLLRAYAHWARRTGNPLARKVTDETARFMIDELGADGMFISSLDADADGRGGPDVRLDARRSCRSARRRRRPLGRRGFRRHARRAPSSTAARCCNCPPTPTTPNGSTGCGPRCSPRG